VCSAEPAQISESAQPASSCKEKQNKTKYKTKDRVEKQTINIATVIFIPSNLDNIF
jgi:hypothetical protein